VLARDIFERAAKLRSFSGLDLSYRAKATPDLATTQVTSEEPDP
jgi:hypothetical protein